jgi:hypothetical protein
MDLEWEDDYKDPFDDVIITDDQIQELFEALTADKTDVELRIRPFGAHIQWAERRSPHWLYVVVPRRRPMDFKAIMGGYRSAEYKMGAVAADERTAIDEALNAMGRTLGLSLKGHIPDWEAVQRFPENKRR